MKTLTSTFSKNSQLSQLPQQNFKYYTNCILVSKNAINNIEYDDY
jgi:hypothetical protein